MALDKAGHECVWANDIDKHAIAIYNNYYGEEYEPEDITKVDAKDIPDHDMLVGGVPCVTEDSLIITDRGTIPIKNVNVGDSVLTHKNRFRKVFKTMNRQAEGIYRVKVQGSPTTYITEEHPFYCRKMIRQYKSRKEGCERLFSTPNWIDSRQLREDDFIGLANYSDKHTTNIHNLTEKECWLIGRYIADGYIQNNKRHIRKNSNNHKVIFCVGKSKLDEFNEKTKNCGCHIGINEDRTVYKCRIINIRFMELCLECGKGAINKKVPFFIMNLPKNKLKQFLAGYMSGDGCYSNERYSATSISKVLIYQIGQIVHRLYKTPYNITFCKRPKTAVIEGRTVNQHDTWTVRYDTYTHKQQNGVFIDNNVYGRFVSKEHLSDWKGTVYNLKVEEDNSYTVNNCIVHNCQSWSIAGKRHGFEDAHGTLWYEVFRIADAKKPKFLLLENVKGLISHDEGNSLETILETICNLGYAVDFKVLNSKHFGVPQNRERIFILAIRKDLLNEDEII